jgi:carbohydrate kinase (thermoresistant glucokinase family)
MSEVRLPIVVVLMGVSSSGKSTIGKRLSKLLAWPFRDADSFHPPANIAKMSQGIALNDADRWPWLDAIAHWIEQQLGKGECGLVSCSALKRSYRRRLIRGRTDVRLVYLKGSFELIHKRMQRRRGHFMPPSLLKNQFDVLEEPQADENAVIVSIAPPAQRVVKTIIAELGLMRAGPT